MPDIKQWSDIQSRYLNGAIILGNGSSVTISEKFNYSSLLEISKENNLITADLNTIFEHFQSTDFEHILRMLWHAYHINQALGIGEEKTTEAYIAIREALISSIRLTHPEYADILEHLNKIASFLRNFKTVISLNYDLIVYWSSLIGNDETDLSFKDAFINGRFAEDWQEYTKEYRGVVPTMCYYPHGHIALASDLLGNETKIQCERGKYLLDNIVEKWRTNDYAPLFVCEGTNEGKLQSIRKSRYLSIVYNDILQKNIDNIMIYGFGFGEQDCHILNPMFQPKY